MPLHLQCAHIMAMAVQRVFKEAQVTIGPWIERGFYYDFDLKESITDKDLKRIKKEMQKIIRLNLPFISEEVGACRSLECRALLQWTSLTALMFM